jgi:signal transduction histidine kinase
VRSLLGELHVVLSVEDTGPGVGADKLDKIFEPDYTTKPDGSGLGLAIVCRIVAQHGGALVVEPGDTRGIRMHVHLPLSRPDGMA